MHPKVLTPDAWNVIRTLRKSNILKNWILAGGTGLALQIGHRISDDLDFFTPVQFDSQFLLETLSGMGKTALQDRTGSTLHIRYENTQMSFFRLETPLLFEGTAYRGLTIADPRDIAVMKVIAIGGRGSRKDFIDMYYCLRSVCDLTSLISLVKQRFRSIDYNEYHVLKSLVYFEDAESEPMPDMIKRISWGEVKKAIIAAVRPLSP